MMKILLRPTLNKEDETITPFLLCSILKRCARYYFVFDYEHFVYNF